MGYLSGRSAQSFTLFRRPVDSVECDVGRGLFAEIGQTGRLQP